MWKLGNLLVEKRKLYMIVVDVYKFLAILE